MRGEVLQNYRPAFSDMKTCKKRWDGVRIEALLYSMFEIVLVCYEHAVFLTGSFGRELYYEGTDILWSQFSLSRLFTLNVAFKNINNKNTKRGGDSPPM